jgi:hypothetical protein
MLITIIYHKSQGSPKVFSHLPKAWISMNQLFLSTYPSEIQAPADFVVILVISNEYTDRSWEFHWKFSLIEVTIHMPTLEADK